MDGESPKRKAGRKTKLNKALIDEFVDLIENGAWLEVACDYVGISVRTCYNWIQLGEETHQKLEESVIDSKSLTPKERLLLQFFQAVRSADAKAKVGAVKTLHAAALTDPRFALEFLQRRARDQFGLRGSSANGEGGDSGGITINVLLQQVAIEVRDNLARKSIGTLPEIIEGE